MKYGKFKSLLNATEHIAYTTVFGTETEPVVNIYPIPDGITHVDIGTDVVYVSALQFDHFMNEMRRTTKDAFPDDMDIYTMVFVIVHELLHVKHKNENLSESQINRKAYEKLHAFDRMPENVINTLKLVF